jgi:hypothetical protein
MILVKIIKHTPSFTFENKTKRLPLIDFRSATPRKKPRYATEDGRNDKESHWWLFCEDAF